MNKYLNRYEAGKILGEHLKHYAKNPNAIVLALPRGGVPVAYEIAKALSLPLDLFIVRKLGVPWHEELAMGAIASGDTIFFNNHIINQLNISKEAINQVVQSEKKELKRREKTYRGNKAFPDLKNKIVILVDDGIATGATAQVAIQALRKKNPQRIILAVPVAADSTYQDMSKLADEIICPLTPDDFFSVGTWYHDFSQTMDDEVFQLLNKDINNGDTTYRRFRKDDQ